MRKRARQPDHRLEVPAVDTPDFDVRGDAVFGYLSPTVSGHADDHENSPGEMNRRDGNTLNVLKFRRTGKGKFPPRCAPFLHRIGGLVIAFAWFFSNLGCTVWISHGRELLYPLPSDTSLNARLTGLTLRACFSQQQNTLVLHASQGERSEWLEISCAPAGNYLLPRTSYARARKNSIDLFGALLGDPITGCTMHGRDRQMTIRLASGERIVIQLYGTAANIHWVSPSNLIRASFLKSASTGGLLLLEPENKAIRLPESLEDLQPPEAGQALQAMVKAAFPQLGPVYVREALHRGAGKLPTGQYDRED